MKKIKIVSDGTTSNTRFYDSETGTEIRGVRSLCIPKVGPRGIIIAELEIVLPELEMETWSIWHHGPIKIKGKSTFDKILLAPYQLVKVYNLYNGYTSRLEALRISLQSYFLLFRREK